MPKGLGTRIVAKSFFFECAIADVSVKFPTEKQKNLYLRLHKKKCVSCSKEVDDCIVINNVTDGKREDYMFGSKQVIKKN